jgi:hypothetical protein
MNYSPGFYDMNGRKIPVLEWERIFHKDRHVGDTYLRTHYGDYRVSTVLLGINYDFTGQGRPIIFETMVFGDGLAHVMARYATRRQAARGHRLTVRMFRMPRKQLLHKGGKP